MVGMQEHDLIVCDLTLKSSLVKPYLILQAYTTAETKLKLNLTKSGLNNTSDAFYAITMATHMSL